MYPSGAMFTVNYDRIGSRLDPQVDGKPQMNWMMLMYQS